jgi:putative DNA primase/helicase
LAEELTAELAGILSWSLDGLDRLTRQGKFTESKSSTDSNLALQDFVSPVAAFVRDRCRSALVTRSQCGPFGDWRLWWEDNGRKPGSVQTFGRDLRAVIPTLKVTRPRADDDSRVRHFQGVKLRTARNGWGRGPVRTSTTTPANSSPVRDGPQSNPLWAEVCSDCGEPYEQPGLVSRCTDRHQQVSH